MKTLLCPGSYDPPTNGHLDIIRRAAGLCEELVVLVTTNPEKRAFLPAEQRSALLREALSEVPNARVELCPRMLAEAVRRFRAGGVVKGLRNGADFEYELVQARFNRELCGAETVFLPASPALAHVSSSAVRQLVAIGADPSPYVPACVLRALDVK